MFRSGMVPCHKNTATDERVHFLFLETQLASQDLIHIGVLLKDFYGAVSWQGWVGQRGNRQVSLRGARGNPKDLNAIVPNDPAKPM